MAGAITKGLLLVTALVWVAWDVVAILWSGPDATISAIVMRGGERWIVIPWAVGVLCGHFFWVAKEHRADWVKLSGMGVCILLFSAGMLWPDPAASLFFESELAALLTGVVAGRALWPQGGPDGGD